MIDMQTIGMATEQADIYETDWDKITGDANAAASTAQQQGDLQKKQIFLKVKQGFHTIRLLPGGNKLDKLPYMRIVQHSIQSYDVTTGRQKTEFTLCWNWMFENLTSKTDAEARKNNTIIGYLIKQGKLLNEDMKRYQEHKCPFCSAFQVMDTYGIDKQTRNKFLGKEQYMFNVYWRQTQASGDNSIYIWGTSKTQFNKIVTSLKMFREAGQNPMDLNNGNDWVLQAQGEGFGGAGQGRRYDIQCKPGNIPCNIGQQIVYDLAEIASNSFKTYQESVNLLKKMGGELLQSIGYTIPGDQIVTDQYKPIPQVTPVIVQSQPVPPATPVANVAVRQTNEEAIEINGMLYIKQADGSLRPAF